MTVREGLEEGTPSSLSTAPTALRSLCSATHALGSRGPYGVCLPGSRGRRSRLWQRQNARWAEQAAVVMVAVVVAAAAAAAAALCLEEVAVVVVVAGRAVGGAAEDALGEMISIPWSSVRTKPPAATAVVAPGGAGGAGGAGDLAAGRVADSAGRGESMVGAGTGIAVSP